MDHDAPPLHLERRLAIQYAIARAFAQADDVVGVAELVLTTLCEELGWESASLWVRDEASRELRCAAVVPQTGRLARWAEGTLALRVHPGEGLPGRVWASGQATWVRDTDTDHDFRRRDLAREVGLGHGFAFPVRARGATAAVVELFAASIREVDDAQAEFLETVATQLGSFLDLVEARRAVAASEIRKSAILQAAIDAIVVADADGRIVEFNTAAERLFGHPRERAVGSTIGELLVPLDLRAAHLAGIERYVMTRVPTILGQRIRTRALRADGGTVPVELTLTAAILGGRPLFTAFIRDITRERQAEIARERFLEVLSHELRTPVTSIYGGATVLARPSLDPESRSALLEDIAAEADRLHRLVEDLVVLARAERGDTASNLEPVHVDRIADRVVRAAQARWPRLTFRLTSHGPRRATQGDETYVEQVLRNLVSNAAKYAAGGIEIDVAIDHGPTESTVRVLDRGPGIDENEVARLFEIDYRSPLTDGLAQGSGIGLFVARWLVETMGGRIWASRRDGGGSEFGFALLASELELDRPGDAGARPVALGLDAESAVIADDSAGEDEPAA